jgi:hypothetical protein
MMPKEMIIKFISGKYPVLKALMYTAASMDNPTRGIRRYMFLLGFTVQGIDKGSAMVSFFISAPRNNLVLYYNHIIFHF